MAGDVNERSAPLAVEAPAPLVIAPPRSERARSTVYRLRFGIVYVLLAAVVGAAVGTFIVLASGPDKAPAADWSTWRPDGDASRDAAAKQIADHVSKEYRLPSGRQLAAVLVGPPVVQDVRVRAIAVRPDTSTGQAEEGDIAITEAQNSMMFILCGLGQSCSIDEGQASMERHQLLRREALELSLYTFKYVRDVDSVTVFLPPNPADKDSPGTSVFLKSRDVRDELRGALPRTLTAPVTPGIGEIESAEGGTIDRITRQRTYSYEFQQAQDGTAVLVLTPVVVGS